MKGPTTIVVHGRLFQVIDDVAGAPRSMTVTISADGQREWTFEEPAWRALGYGLGDAGFYLWSARHVISFADATVPEPDLIQLDEDIIAAFQFGATWVVVCETSVRLVGKAGELSRIELGEVASSARLVRGVLILYDRNGIESRLEVGATRLKVVA